MVCFEAKCKWNWNWSSSHFLINLTYSYISATASLQLHAGLGFFEPTFCLPSISLIIHSKNQSQLIEYFRSIFIFWKNRINCVWSTNQFIQLLFLNGTLGKVFIFVKSCNHSSLHVIMHFWLKKTKATSFLDMHQSRPENLFIMVAQFSCQCDFATFFASPRYFLHFGKFSADTRNDALVYACHNQFTMQFWRMVNWLKPA